MFFLPVLLAVG